MGSCSVSGKEHVNRLEQLQKTLISAAFILSYIGFAAIPALGTQWNGLFSSAEATGMDSVNPKK